mgnify:CR=1 FL=1
MRAAPGAVAAAVAAAAAGLRWYAAQAAGILGGAAADTEITGVRVPAGSQVLIMYASANRDELEWERPEVFDITRDAGRHVGFGQGAHACAAQALARLETTEFLRALIARVGRLELTGPPEWTLNNIIRRHSRVPLRLVGS